MLRSSALTQYHEDKGADNNEDRLNKVRPYHSAESTCERERYKERVQGNRTTKSTVHTKKCWGQIEADQMTHGIL